MLVTRQPMYICMALEQCWDKSNPMEVSIQLIAYASKELTETEQWYAQIELGCDVGMREVSRVSFLYLLQSRNRPQTSSPSTLLHSTRCYSSSTIQTPSHVIFLHRHTCTRERAAYSWHPIQSTCQQGRRQQRGNLPSRSESLCECICELIWDERNNNPACCKLKENCEKSKIDWTSIAVYSSQDIANNSRGSADEREQSCGTNFIASRHPGETACGSLGDDKMPTKSKINSQEFERPLMAKLQYLL